LAFEEGGYVASGTRACPPRFLRRAGTVTRTWNSDRALAEIPCRSDEEFVHRAAYILEFADGDEFDEIHAVNALKAYLEQRQAWAARLVSR
jgi:hypothetical protein